MRITAVSGGIGGARLLRGLLHVLDPADEVTVIGNTADDIWLFGLKICPDLDTVMYTLGGGIDEERGWGRLDETWQAKEELAAYGVEPTWFGLGDRDLATHVVRTQMLQAGYPLSDVTAALCARWLGDLSPAVRLLPMSDDRVETHVVIDRDGERAAIHFQEYWVRLHAEPAVRDVVVVGVEDSAPAPGVLEAISDCDVLIVPPSNPVVSVGTVLAVPGLRDAVRATPAPVVGLSPIVGGAAVRGMAAPLLGHLGVEVSAAGVGAHYGARDRGGVLDGWLVDETDAAAVPVLEAAGLSARAVPLLMPDVAKAGAMAQAALDLAAELSGAGVTTLHVRPVTGLPRLGAGDDLAALLVAALGPDGLREGDVLCVSSKAVAKTEGRTRTAEPRRRGRRGDGAPGRPPRPAAGGADPPGTGPGGGGRGRVQHRARDGGAAAGRSRRLRPRPPARAVGRRPGATSPWS